MKPKSGTMAAQKKRKRTRISHRAFRVSASLINIAAATTVFPTPLGKTKDVARYLTANSPAELKCCKLCDVSYAKDRSLIRHWLGVHAFKDLKVALNLPKADHSKLVINSTRKRDILLAAVYTCPLEGCRASDTDSQVAVFVTKDYLANHIRAHCEYLEDPGKEIGPDATLESQMWEQFETHVSKHPFWQGTGQDLAHFACRDSKLVWMLNQ
jgi:hypothetical protein